MNTKTNCVLLNRPLKKLAFVLSVLFHPLLVPSMVFCTLLYYHSFELVSIQKETLLAWLVGSTFLLPALLILLLYSLNFIPSIQMNVKEERKIPMLLTIGVYAVTTCLLSHFIGKYHILTIAMFTIALSVVFVFMITCYWKISAHATGIAGWLGVCLYLFIKNDFSHPYTFLLLLVLLINVLVLTSRKILHAHTYAQLAAGFLLGLSISFSAIQFLVK
ncbi:MAG: hypothetical protein AB8B61_10355 [Cyclobacteriaceae bacterium]